MEYREAIADVELDQKPWQELDGSATLCSSSLNNVRSSTIRRRDDVSWATTPYIHLRLSWPGPLHDEAKDTRSIASNCYLRPETYEEPPRSERLSGALHCDTQPVLRSSASIAIWIKNRSSVIIRRALKALHGLHSAAVALWIKNNSFVISQTALKTLHAWFLGGDELLGATRLPHRPLDEVSELIDTCRALREHENIDSTMRQTLTRNRLLHRHTKEMVLDFQEKARILLSLLAWHFDPKTASVSHGLLRFFDQPYAQLGAVCTNIYPIYSKLHEVESEQCLEEDLNRLIKLLRRAVVSEPWVLY